MNQHTFLRDQFHGMVLQATVQRANIYRGDAPEEQREDFRRSLRAELDRLSSGYDAPVPEHRHVAHIAELADVLSRGHGSILRDGRFRIGPAQKALNLFLKYRWAAGWMPEPPHCPFDRIIIDKLPRNVQCNWTDLDDLDGYRALVEAARAKAGPVSLAVWVIRTYDANSLAAQRSKHRR